MTERYDAGYEARVDRELDLRGIVLTGLGLALVVVVFAALMWWLLVTLRGAARAADPPPPALPEARVVVEPPEPRLQSSPEQDMRRMRAEEEMLLGGWAWVDEGAGIARVPIERAMEIVAERGLPEPAGGYGPPAAAAPVENGGSGGESADPEAGPPAGEGDS